MSGERASTETEATPGMTTHRVARVAPVSGGSDASATVQAPPMSYVDYAFVSDLGCALTRAWLVVRDGANLVSPPKQLDVFTTLAIPMGKGAVTVGLCSRKGKSKKLEEDLVERVTIEAWPWRTVGAYFGLGPAEMARPNESDNASLIRVWCFLSNLGVAPLIKADLIEAFRGAIERGSVLARGRALVYEGLRRLCHRARQEFLDAELGGNDDTGATSDAPTPRARRAVTTTADEVLHLFCRWLCSPEGTAPARSRFLSVATAILARSNSLTPLPGDRRINCDLMPKESTATSLPARSNLSTTRLTPSLMGGGALYLPNTRDDSVGVRPLFLLQEPSSDPHVKQGADVYYLKHSLFVLPGDWPVDSLDRWAPGEETILGEALPLIDGQATFDRFFEVLGVASKGEVFIVVGWSLRTVGITSRSEPAREHFKRALGRGVKVYFLLWDNLHPIYQAYIQQSRLELTPIFDNEAKKNGGEIVLLLDDHVRSPNLAASGGRSLDLGVGCHHQKIILASVNSVVFGFCGGVDLNADRILDDFNEGGPQHDVHMELRGKATQGLLKIVQDRVSWLRDQWTKEVLGRDLAGLSRLETALEALAKKVSANDTHGAKYNLRVVRTIGTPGRTEPSDLWPAIKAAIEGSKRSIYLEDQYFWSQDAAQALNAAVRRGVSLTVLLPLGTKAGGAALRRRAFNDLIEGLSAAEFERTGVYMLSSPRDSALPGVAGLHTYVHSKCWMIDDEVAIVGSANCNNRGYFHDSEVGVRVFDLDWHDLLGSRRGRWYHPELNFARALRISLWSEHLQMAQTDSLVDPVGAQVYWRLERGRVRSFRDDGGAWNVASPVTIFMNADPKP